MRIIFDTKLSKLQEDMQKQTIVLLKHSREQVLNDIQKQNSDKVENDMKLMQEMKSQTLGLDTNQSMVLDSHMIVITKMINKVQEEYVPKRIERALETVDAKINLAISKQEQKLKDLKKSIKHLEEVTLQGQM